MAKEPRSFSIDADIDQVLRDRDDLNASAAVNKFLREYVSSGRGEEAALAVRLEQLDSEIADAEAKLERLKRERERVEESLEQRRTDLREMLNEAEAKVRDGAFPRENIHTDNAAIQRWASNAGVPPQRFVSELSARV